MRMKDQKVYLYADIGSEWNRRFISEDHFNYEKEMIKLRTEMVRTTLNNLRLQSWPNDERAIKQFMKTVEKRMRSLIKKYDLYELIFWSRRLPPTTNSMTSCSDNTIALYREILFLAIQKYARRNKRLAIDDNKRLALPGYVLSSDINGKEIPSVIRDVLADIYRLEYLAYLYVYGTQRYRILNKGGKLISLGDDIFDVQVDDVTGRMIDLYDERIWQFTNIFARFGSNLDLSSFSLSEDKVKSAGVGVAYVSNLGLRRQSALVLPGHKPQQMNTNYLLARIDLDRIDNFLELFGQEFERIYGFSAKHFTLFLRCVSVRHFAYISDSPEAQVTFLQRGYEIMQPKSFLKKLSVIASALTNEKPKRLEGVFKKIYKLLRRDIFTSRVTNLQDRRGRKMIIPLTRDFVILDLAGLAEVMGRILDVVASMRGATGNKKGAHFEKRVRNILESFYKDSCWQVNELKSRATKESKEIDASFFLGEYLFLLECKSHRIRDEFDRGDREAIEYRKKKIKEAIGQVDSKAQFVSKYGKTLDQKLPSKDIRYVVPIVVMPAPEYIWEESEALFLDGKMPRVITPMELDKIKSIDFQQLKDRSYVYELA